jgi:hypothetical protein
VTKGRTVALIAVIAVVVIAAASGIVWWRTHPSKPDTQPAAAAPVAISVPNAPRKLTIGMIVTLSSKPGQGADDKYAAEGARVAAERLSMGGVTVELKTVDDKGTTDGAAKAVKQLAAKDVSGIVAASQGSHLKGAVSAAAKADIPLLLPYESDAGLLGDNSWSTGPSDSMIGKALHQALSSAKLTKPLVIDAGGGVPDAVDPTTRLSYAVGGDSGELIKKVKRVAKPGGVDSVLISGPADQQAAVVAALQGATIDLPIYLTPDATSQAFSDALVKAGGSLSTNLTTVGPNWGDPAALQSDEDGRAMSSFLTAVRLTAADSKQTTLMGDQPFTVATNAADTRSHDAVIALSRAAGEAQSGTASDVAKALSGLQLGHVDGLAGPDLDFSDRTALVPQSVVTLRSSDQDLGLRPTATDSDSDDESTGARLIWFAQPSTK